MVQIGKLWGDAKFASLSPYSKLLYCYLISQPSISTLGVLVLSNDKILIDLKIKDESVLDNSFNELEGRYIKSFFCEENIRTIIIVDHYRSLAKSKANIRKGLDEGKSSQGMARELLLDIFTKADFQNDTFVPPTAEEVSDYAMSLGYQVNGRAFVDYYADNDWYDKNNKKVRAWKSKVSKVWCREENKLETVKGAPKGYEYFFVDVDGARIFPESWRDDLPSHSNFIYAQYLIDEYNGRR